MVLLLFVVMVVVSRSMGGLEEMSGACGQKRPFYAAYNDGPSVEENEDVDEGVDEFSHVNEDDLRSAMPVLARLGAPLLVHAESPSYLPQRPPESECDAIAMMIRLSRETGARVHIVHLAAVLH